MSMARTLNGPSGQARADAFWSRVAIGAPDECWPFMGHTTYQGYGVVGSGQRAHRIAYEDRYGAIPEGWVICHHCDNPPCCNPAHLFAGTQQDNVLDAMAKGRHVVARFRGSGEKNGRAKLTEAEVLELRARRAAGERLIVLAEEFGIGDSQVARIALGRSWKHLPLSVSCQPSLSETAA